MVLKRLVAVALVATRLVINAVVALSTEAKNEVDVPLSVNELVV